MLRRPQRSTPGASCISVEESPHLEDCQVSGLEIVQPSREVAVEPVCSESCLIWEVSDGNLQIQDRIEYYHGLVEINTYEALGVGPFGRSKPASIHTCNFDLRHCNAHMWALVHHTSAVFCDTPHSPFVTDGLS
jgi:hypothetical protein